MKSLHRNHSQAARDLRKTRWLETLLATSILVAVAAIAAVPVSPPQLKPAQEILAGVLPKSCWDMVPDEDGNLWYSDLHQQEIVNITLAGKVIKVMEGAQLFPDGLEGPTGLSLWGSLLAVEDGNKRIHILDVKAGRLVRTIPYETLHGDFKMNPAFGFSLWKDRILFTGLGFEGPPPPADQPVQVLTLFSTGLDGRGLDVVKREYLSVQVRPGRTLFGLGFSASLPGGDMAVCQALPARLILLGPQGKVLQEAAVPGLDVPLLPRTLMRNENLQAETLAATPHVTGLFTLKDWIGLVLQRPSPAGPRLSVAWFSSHLDLVREEGVELPVKLTKWDVVARVIGSPPNGVLFLVRHREPGAMPTARLYRSQVQ